MSTERLDPRSPTTESLEDGGGCPLKWGCWACCIVSAWSFHPWPILSPLGYQGLAAMPPGLRTPGQNRRSMGEDTAVGTFSTPPREEQTIPTQQFAAPKAVPGFVAKETRGTLPRSAPFLLWIQGGARPSRVLCSLGGASPPPEYVGSQTSSGFLDASQN